MCKVPRCVSLGQVIMSYVWYLFMYVGGPALCFSRFILILLCRLSRRPLSDGYLTRYIVENSARERSRPPFFFSFFSFFSLFSFFRFCFTIGLI